MVFFIVDRDPVPSLEVAPSMITVSPDTRLFETTDMDRDTDQFAIFYMAATLLQEEVVRAVKVYRPNWTNGQIFDRVRGSLMMQNWDNEGHTWIDDATLQDINSVNFKNTFARARANGSNPALQVLDVDWRYWINPASLLVGGGKAFRNVLNLKGINQWDKHFKDDKFGCAAVALAIGYDRVVGTRHKDSKWFNDQKLKDWCINMQQRMCWPDPHNVTVDQFGNFVDCYTDWRVAVLSAKFLNSFIYCGEEYERDSDHKKDKTIFIYYDHATEHYVPVSAVIALTRSIWSMDGSMKFCYDCCSPCRGGKCHCEKVTKEKQESKRKLCDGCGENYYAQNKHTCGYTNCLICRFDVDKTKYADHRCPLNVSSASFWKSFVGEDEKDFGEEYQNRKNKNDDYKAFAWDLESCMIPMDGKMTEDYLMNEDGTYDEDAGVMYITKLAQVPNYICVVNIFDEDEVYEFDTMEEFVRFAMSHNKGLNYFYAHNAAGYDNRLLFETIATMTIETPKPIMAGQKFIMLSIGKTMFYDSMRHISRGLEDLGVAFGLDVGKGHYPHLLQDPNYVGVLPGIENWSTKFIRTGKKRADLLTWYAEASLKFSDGSYDAMAHRREYGKNDTIMLAQILKIYHDDTMTILKNYPHLQVSPLFFPTVAGAHHKYQIFHLNIGVDLKKMPADQMIEYSANTWCRLSPEEYYYARQAFRGGMTGITKYIHEGPAHYVDIQSSYPSVQMDVNNLYPVGAPVIEIHDDREYPCGYCVGKEKPCYCTYNRKVEQRAEFRNNKLTIIKVECYNLEKYCREFDGIITVDLICPDDLYHPLITKFDAKKKKVIGSLEPIIRETIPSVILKRALDLGYVVTKIWRADRYKMAPSIWRNGLLADMYLAKMMYSGKPKEEDWPRMKQTFMDTIGLDLGDMSKWESNPTRKDVAKLWLNCGWGKHGESLDHGLVAMFKRDDYVANGFYEDLMVNKAQATNVEIVGDNLKINYKQNRAFIKADTHKTYLPAAIFVTAYGRLKLHEELVKIDPRGTPREKLRVLMYDTDSVVYACGNHEVDYHTKTGDCIGDWEVEKPEIKGLGIKGFYAIAPKSYAIEFNKGDPIIHLKGACLAYMHSKMFTPQIAKELVLAKRPGEEELCSTVALPQRQLKYKLGKGEKSMYFEYYRKVVQFQPHDVKGVFSWDDYRAYPIGFK